MERIDHQTGIAKQISTYSDATEVRSPTRWLFTAGTPGLTQDGHLPKGIVEQSELAWKNILDALAKADMTIANVVKVNTSLIDAGDIPAYGSVRAKVFGDARPASMLAIVPGLVRPEILVEIEVVAVA